MSQNKSKSGEKMTSPKISRSTIFAIGVVLVICIAVIAGVILVKLGPVVQNIPVNASGNASETFTSAGALYSKSVDLA
ncbi:MAG: hypothetical protein ABFC78_07930, partial [Methanoregula sp.]